MAQIEVYSIFCDNIEAWNVSDAHYIDPICVDFLLSFDLFILVWFEWEVADKDEIKFLQPDGP